MKTLMKLGLAFILTVFLASAVKSQPIDDQAYDQYLIQSLKNENIGIRTSAAKLLGERKVQAAVDPLLKMLKTEKKYSARIVAALALYQIGDEKALPALKKVAAKDRNKTVRHVVTPLVLEMQNVQVARSDASQ